MDYSSASTSSVEQISNGSATEGGQSSQKRGRATNQLRYLQNSVMKALWKHKCAWPFHVPVDAELCGCPDYYERITTPMDMTTINKRLESCYYSSATECISDINQMFTNCKNYNRPGEVVYTMCESLEQAFQQKLTRMPAQEKEISPAGSRTKKRAPAAATAPRQPKANRGEKRKAETPLAAADAKAMKRPKTDLPDGLEQQRMAQIQEHDAAVSSEAESSGDESDVEAERKLHALQQQIATVTAQLRHLAEENVYKKKVKEDRRRKRMTRRKRREEQLNITRTESIATASSASSGSSDSSGQFRHLTDEDLNKKKAKEARQMDRMNRRKQKEKPRNTTRTESMTTAHVHGSALEPMDMQTTPPRQKALTNDEVDNAKPMTRDELQQLILDMHQLSPNRLGKVVSIIRLREPSLIESDTDAFEIHFEALKPSTLQQLKMYARWCGRRDEPNKAAEKDESAMDVCGGVVSRLSDSSSSSSDNDTSSSSDSSDSDSSSDSESETSDTHINGRPLTPGIAASPTGPPALSPITHATPSSPVAIAPPPRPVIHATPSSSVARRPTTLALPPRPACPSNTAASKPHKNPERMPYKPEHKRHKSEDKRHKPEHKRHKPAHSATDVPPPAVNKNRGQSTLTSSSSPGSQVDSPPPPTLRPPATPDLDFSTSSDESTSPQPTVDKPAAPTTDPPPTQPKFQAAKKPFELKNMDSWWMVAKRASNESNSGATSSSSSCSSHQPQLSASFEAFRKQAREKEMRAKAQKEAAEMRLKHKQRAEAARKEKEEKQQRAREEERLLALSRQKAQQAAAAAQQQQQQQQAEEEKERRRQQLREQERERRRAQLANQIDLNEQSDVMALFEAQNFQC